MSNPVQGRPRVVAVMPARNSARTLEDVITAIPPDTIDHIILVDNASKDDTVAIAERQSRGFADSGSARSKEAGRVALG